MTQAVSQLANSCFQRSVVDGVAHLNDKSADQLGIVRRLQDGLETESLGELLLQLFLHALRQRDRAANLNAATAAAFFVF